MNKEENNLVEEQSEDVSEKLTEQDVQNVKEAIKKAQMSKAELSPENQALFERMCQEADMPIRLEDKDFKLGKQELDVRHLNRANWRQMEFRQLILQNIYLKQIVMGNTDILRILMIIADKLGVEDIVAATDEIIDKIDAQQKKKNKEYN